MMRKIFRAVVSTFVCLMMLPLDMFAAAEEAKGPFSGGAGTETDPYQIATANDLRMLSELINDVDTNSEYRYCYYIQTADIDLNGDPFIPIGFWSSEKRVGFSGSYDGNCYEITNLYAIGQNYVGLFGWMYNGTIFDLSVQGKIEAYGVNAGGIAGETSGGDIFNCSFVGDVSGNVNVGGIVGVLIRGGTIESCYFNGTLEGLNEVAGIVGGTSDFDDGLVCNTNIENCYAAGEIVENNSADTFANNAFGGIVGEVEIKNVGSTMNIINNYYLNTMSDTGINGDVTTGCTKLASAALKACADMLGIPFVDNCETDGFNDGYPIFEWQSTPYQFKGSGTAEDPYQISSKDELKKMRDLINSTYFGKDYYYCTYLQTADIDLENEQWTPIGKRMKDGVDGALPAFMGNYNGGYHSIYNLNVNETEKFAGLFGSFGNTGTIKNLTVYGTVKSTAPSVGGICGEMCAGNTTIKNCAFIGNVTGGDFGVGGIVGMAWQSAGVVEGCYHNGVVTNTTEVNSAGGIIGSATLDKEGKIEVKNSYHVGQVVGAENVSGEIIGNVKNTAEGNISIINCCYRAGDATVGNNGTCTEATVYDLTSNLLKKSAEDLGSPFVTSPSDSLNDGYPVFAWQLDTWGKGDINLDGEVNVADAVYLQGYLLGEFSLTETEWHAADLIDDKYVDAFDLCLLKRLLIKNEVT